MSNELATAEKTGALAAAGYTSRVSLTQKEAEEATGIKATSFFPYIQLVSRQSPLSKTYQEGDFILKRGGSDKNPILLGKEFGAVPIAVRASSAFRDGDVYRAEYRTIINGETVTTPKFVEYKEKAEADKKARVEKSPYQYGLDLLVWIPGEACYAIFTGRSISAIQAIMQDVTPYLLAPELENMYSPVTLSSREQSNANYTWIALTCEPLSVEDVVDWEAIDENMLVDALDLFNKPFKPKVEGAEEVEAPARKR